MSSSVISAADTFVSGTGSASVSLTCGSSPRIPSSKAVSVSGLSVFSTFSTSSVFESACSDGSGLGARLSSGFAIISFSKVVCAGSVSFTVSVLASVSASGCVVSFASSASPAAASVGSKFSVFFSAPFSVCPILFSTDGCDIP